MRPDTFVYLFILEQITSQWKVTMVVRLGITDEISVWFQEEKQVPGYRVSVRCLMFTHETIHETKVTHHPISELSGVQPKSSGNPSYVY